MRKSKFNKNQNKNKWKNALEAIWFLNRVHVGSEMSKAYRILKQYYKDLKIFGFPTGMKCGGWVIPPAWDVKTATLKNPAGNVIADWKKNKLSLYYIL